MNPPRTKFPVVVKVGSVSVRIHHSIDRGKYSKFTVSDYSTGKRRLRQFSDFANAKSEAERLANALARGEAAAASLGPTERASYGRAVELLAPTGDTLELACAQYAAATAILGNGSLLEAAAREFIHRHGPARDPKATRAVADEFLQLRKNQGASPRYLEDLRARLNKFCETFASIPIAAVTTGDVQKWLDGLGLSPQSVVNFRRVLVTLFAHAEARIYIPQGENPALRCETPKVRRPDVEVYSPDDLLRLLRAAPEAFRPCLAIGALAGLRSAEIERLTWDAIDLKRGYLKVTAGKAKTGSRRLVPICDALKSWLARDVAASGLLWPGAHEEFYEAQLRTAKATGNPETPAIQWKQNGLRHSFASYRLAATSDAAKVAHEMGNSPAVVHAHYAELVTPEDATIWFQCSRDSVLGPAQAEHP